jgi:hypothetical protein
MISCRDCGASQAPGALFCTECGRSLVSTSELVTDQLPFITASHEPAPPPLLGQDLGRAGPTRRLNFVIPVSGRRLSIMAMREIRVGRADPTQEFWPELDLTDDGGAEQGVSRFHAAIQFASQGPVLVDRGSTNGTLLNNYRLPPDLPYPLHHGDEIRFGRLLVHLFFEQDVLP